MAKLVIRIRVEAVAPQATNAEILSLLRLVRRMDDLPTKQRRRVRRLLRAAFDELKLLEN